MSSEVSRIRKILFIFSCIFTIISFIVCIVFMTASIDCSLFILCTFIFLLGAFSCFVLNNPSKFLSKLVASILVIFSIFYDIFDIKTYSTRKCFNLKEEHRTYLNFYRQTKKKFLYNNKYNSVIILDNENKENE